MKTSSPMDPVKRVLSNEDFVKTASARLRKHAPVLGPSGRLKWSYHVDPGTRVIRMTVLDVAGRIENVVEASEPGDGPTVYTWAVRYCGIEDEAEARRATGFDPRRISEGLSDDFVEVSEELRELRVRMDGIVAAANERSEAVDAELSAEISDSLDALIGRVEECWGE